MGTYFEIVVADDDAALVESAGARIHDLEARWSRFLADSELSIINRSPGRPVIVSPETFDLITAAVDGWRMTDGLFDPTVHDALVGLGYDRTFAAIDQPATVAAGPAPGAADIELDEVMSAVTVPVGTRLDLGGIGKGTAADIVSAELLAAGARGACVSIGGDLRVRGESPTGDGWIVAAHNAIAASQLPRLHDGGVCTSTTTKRRWTTAAGEMHHLVDPATGHSTSGEVQTVTVVGATAQQAEVLTKAAIVAGSGASELLERFDVRATLTTV